MVGSFVNLVKSLDIDGLKVAEVGVREGLSMGAYLPYVAARGGHVYAIDWFKGNPYRTSLHAENQDKTDNEWYDRFVSNISSYQDFCTILRGHSSYMSEYIANRSLDICFIDGDHRYWQVMADIELYLPKVKIGGILCGHDIDGRGKSNEFTAYEMYRYVVYKGEHISIKQAVYDSFGEDYQNIEDKVWVHTVNGNETIDRN